MPAQITTRERDAAVKLKEAEAKEKSDKTEIEKERVKIDKLRQLESLITASVVDSDSTGAGIFDQKYIPVFDESETQRLKDKIFDIVHTL